MRVSKLNSALIKVFALESFRLGRFRQAHDQLKNAGDKYHASGVIVTIKNLSGETIVESFGISDGLSAETIAALQADIVRTSEMQIALNRIKKVAP